MSLIDSGIHSVRAFALPAGIARMADASKLTRRFGEMAFDVDRKTSSGLRQRPLCRNDARRSTKTDGRSIPTSPESPVRIEVFAVELQEADTDFASELGQPVTDTGRVKITLLRSQNLPVGAA